VYRPCIASFEAELQEPETSTMGPKRKDDFEPYWDDEKDWLCTVEFLPTDDQIVDGSWWKQLTWGICFSLK
jgi:hypothetical protein